MEVHSHLRPCDQNTMSFIVKKHHVRSSLKKVQLVCDKLFETGWFSLMLINFYQ